MTRTANLGFPRIGARRELKWALERYWRGEDPGGTDLERTAAMLRERHWRLQSHRGIDMVPSGDFSLYDQVLDMAVALGAVPSRFGPPRDPSGGDAQALDQYFAMARGATGCPALELTKWFDTNYHYLVPELEPDQQFTYCSTKYVQEFREAAALGITTRPVLIGAVTFLHLAKRIDAGSPIEMLDAVIPAYTALVGDLVASGAQALQIDEPALVLDLDDATRSAFRVAYAAIRQAAGGAEITLTTYFASLGPNAATALSLPVDTIHLDLVRAPGQLEDILGDVPAHMGLSLGVVDGRNVWRGDLNRALGFVRQAVGHLGADRVSIAPSCSLLHLPVDLANETGGDDELNSWMAFATQRLEEVALLGQALGGDQVGLAAVPGRARVLAARSASPRVRRREVQERLAAVTGALAQRRSPYPVRREAQRSALQLPVLPTTTIGSFPQTAEVRQWRSRLRSGDIDLGAYEAGLEAETRSCIARQEALDVDVLVHGEFERTDMVEYFGQQLDGFATTSGGWVQSYGSRCVKPPVLFGDVARPAPMTLRWSTFAASLTHRPVKGMLTGPVTILQWSFVRDDQPESESAWQVALALRDEVVDLEAAGIGIIQIDEPALREGLPLRRENHAAYLAWATMAFRIAAGGVADETQIHTHMCYGEFGDILDAIIALDADVISVEASRSGMEFLGEFGAHGYPNEIGPGVWDIHSPRIPSPEEIDGLLGRALDVFGPDRLWVNPDCGLKTRGWAEVEASLANMVGAAKRARARLAHIATTTSPHVNPGSAKGSEHGIDRPDH